MEVPVAGVAEDGGVEAEPLDLGAGERHGAGQLGDRHARVGRALVPARGGRGHRVRRVVAGGPEPGARRRVALVDDLGRALRLGELAHEHEVGLDGRLRSGRLDEQARAFGVVGAAVGVDRRKRPGVEQLQPRDRRAGSDGRGGRPAGGVDRRERDALRDDVLRDPVEPDAHLGDHGERSFGPDEQARQVVAGRRLPRAAAGPDDRPVGEHRLERRGRWRASSRSGSSSSRPHSSRPSRRASRPRRDRPGRRARARPAARSSAVRVTPA